MTIVPQRVAKTRKRFREIALYIVFLFFFTFSAVVVVQDQSTYHFGNNIRAQLTGTAFDRTSSYVTKDFADCATIDELFQWIEGPFFRAVYSSDSYTGDFTPLGGGPSTIAGYPLEALPDTPPLSTEPQRGFLFGHNKIIGGVRVATLRSKERECTRMPDFKWEDDGNKPRCFGNEAGAFDLETELTEDYGDIAGKPFTWSGNGWGESYTTVEQQRTSGLPVIRTAEGNWFPIPAFPVILPNSNASEALEIIQAIKSGNYIDQHTRLVTIEMSIYNPMIDFMCSIRLSITFPKAGGLLPSSDMDVVRLYRWFETSSTLFIVTEVITALFYIYYFVEAVRDARKVGWRATFSGETLVQNTNIGFYATVWVLRGVSIAWAPPVDEVVVASDVYYSFRSAAVYKALSLYCNAVNAFLAWFKLTSYLSYFPQFGLVTGTLRRSLNAVGGFIVIFGVLLYGFAAAHMMTFGPSLEGYRNMQFTAYSLIRALLGDFDLESMEEAQYVMGPLLFILFTAVAVFVVLNLLIAIISDAYTDQQEELSKTAEENQAGQELREYLAVKVAKLPCLSIKSRAWLLGIDEASAKLLRPHRCCGMPKPRPTKRRSNRTAPMQQTLPAVREAEVDEDAAARTNASDGAVATTSMETKAGATNPALEEPVDSDAAIDRLIEEEVSASAAVGDILDKPASKNEDDLSEALQDLGISVADSEGKQ